MEKKEKRIYETPRLTTVTFRAERGYATSGLTAVYLSLITSGAGGSQSLESRESTGTYWGGGSSESWF